MKDSYFNQVIEEVMRKVKRNKTAYVFTVSQKDYLQKKNPKLKFTRVPCSYKDLEGNYIYEVRA